MDIPSLLHSFLHRYKPIPVDFLFASLPFVPVKPFSNTRVISPFFIPIPLSFIYNITFSLCCFAYISISDGCPIFHVFNAILYNLV